MQGIDATIILYLKFSRLGIEGHTFNSSIQDAEGGRCFGVQGQCGGLYSKFQGSQVYIERFCLKKKEKSQQSFAIKTTKQE